MKTQNRNPIEAALSRCVDYAFAEHDHSTHMRSVLVSIEDPGKWPLDLNALRSLGAENKQDAFFLLTWFVSIGSDGIRGLIPNGDQIFQRLIDQETQAVLSTATDDQTWTTGYWKKDGLEAMRYRFGTEITENFDEKLLSDYLNQNSKETIEEITRQD